MTLAMTINTFFMSSFFSLPFSFSISHLLLIFLTLTLSLFPPLSVSVFDFVSPQSVVVPHPITTQCIPSSLLSSLSITPLIRDAVPPIRLLRESWAGHWITTAIARILLSESNGFSVDILDAVQGDPYDIIGSGGGDVNIEVWFYSFPTAPYYENIESGKIASMGSNGMLAQSGFYIPQYTLDLLQNDNVDFWRSFELSSELLSYFSRSGTLADHLLVGDGRMFAPQRCVLQTNPPGCDIYGDYNTDFVDRKCNITEFNPTCIEIYAIDPSYDPLNQMIRNIKLNFTIAYLGESNFYDAVAAALQQGKHFILYNWTPSPFISIYSSLVRITLPRCTPHSFDNSTTAFNGYGSVDCDFVEQNTLKIISTALIDTPSYQDAIHTLQNIDWDTNEILSLMGSFPLNGFNDTVWEDTSYQLACQWIMDHPTTWAPWIFNAPISSGDYTGVMKVVGIILFAAVGMVLLFGTIMIYIWRGRYPLRKLDPYSMIFFSFFIYPTLIIVSLSFYLPSFTSLRSFEIYYLSSAISLNLYILLRAIKFRIQLEILRLKRRRMRHGKIVNQSQWNPSTMSSSSSSSSSSQLSVSGSGSIYGHGNVTVQKSVSGTNHSLSLRSNPNPNANPNIAIPHLHPTIQNSKEKSKSKLNSNKNKGEVVEKGKIQRKKKSDTNANTNTNSSGSDFDHSTPAHHKVSLSYSNWLEERMILEKQRGETFEKWNKYLNSPLYFIPLYATLLLLVVGGIALPVTFFYPNGDGSAPKVSTITTDGQKILFMSTRLSLSFFIQWIIFFVGFVWITMKMNLYKFESFNIRKYHQNFVYLWGILTLFQLLPSWLSSSYEVSFYIPLSLQFIIYSFYWVWMVGFYIVESIPMAEWGEKAKRIFSVIMGMCINGEEGEREGGGEGGVESDADADTDGTDNRMDDDDDEVSASGSDKSVGDRHRHRRRCRSLPPSPLSFRLRICRMFFPFCFRASSPSPPSSLDFEFTDLLSAKRSITLEDILSSPIGYKYFLLHCMGEFSEDNLVFWKSAKLYQSAPTVKRMKEIGREFFAQKSGNLINIPVEMRRELIEEMDSIEMEWAKDEVQREWRAMNLVQMGMGGLDLGNNNQMLQYLSGNNPNPNPTPLPNAINRSDSPPSPPIDSHQIPNHLNRSINTDGDSIHSFPLPLPGSIGTDVDSSPSLPSRDTNHPTRPTMGNNPNNWRETDSKGDDTILTQQSNPDNLYPHHHHSPHPISPISVLTVHSTPTPADDFPLISSTSPSSSSHSQSSSPSPIPFPLASSLLHRISHVFDVPMKEIFSLMSSDIFSRFKGSKLLERFVKGENIMENEIFENFNFNEGRRDGGGEKWQGQRQIERQRQRKREGDMERKREKEEEKEKQKEREMTILNHKNGDPFPFFSQRTSKVSPMSLPRT